MADELVNVDYHVRELKRAGRTMMIRVTITLCLQGAGAMTLVFVPDPYRAVLYVILTLACWAAYVRILHLHRLALRRHDWGRPDWNPDGP